MQIGIFDDSGHMLALVEVTPEAKGWFLGRLLDDKFSNEIREALAAAAEAASQNTPAVYDEIWRTHLVGRLRAGVIPEDAKEVWDLQVDFATSAVAVRFNPH